MTTHAPFRTLHRARAFVFAVCACAAISLASASHAQLTAYGDTGQPTEAQFNALGVTAVPITGVPPMTYTVYTTSAGSETLTLTDGSTMANGNLLQRRDQQGGGSTGNYAGNFPSGTPLIRNVVTTSTSNTADGLLITFSSAVSAFGFNYDPTLVGRETDFTFQVSEGASVTTFTQLDEINTGQAPPNAGNVTAPFFGVSEGNGNLITSILIVGSPTPGAISPVNTTPNDFAVGLLRFRTTAPTNVPEPGTVALLAASALPLGLLARRRQRG